MISDLSRSSSDDKICKATVPYQNSTEVVDRFTNCGRTQHDGRVGTNSYICWHAIQTDHMI